MKVLKVGNYKEVFPLKIVCKRIVDSSGYGYGEESDYCGSELEVDKEDILVRPWDKYPDESGTDYGVVCPICKSFVMVNPKLIPSSIQKSCKKYLDYMRENNSVVSRN